ncbi:paired amphipathic helix protein Sin3-like 3 [Herrania umbratica]|uniref:Paired amphipathic helix protein Sin3-like 3 n=1 Tax=Herrania umbratica TaxID=108875 RepID=A0A6J1BID8_9ROSI|nr:paired amphipathic helix protein Sin3-like 3 [Herrania umbratica]
MKVFCEKFKGKVSSDDYSAMLEHLHAYSSGRITVIRLKEMMEDLLGKYPGLFDHFLHLFNASHGLPPPLQSAKTINKRKRSAGSEEGVGETHVRNKKIIRLRLTSSSVPILDHPESTSRNDRLSRALRFCDKVRKETSSEKYLALLRCLHYYGTGKITKDDMMKLMADEFSEFEQDFRQVLEFYESLSQPSPKAGDKAKKPNKEIKSSTTQRQVDELTPSYRFLPKNLSAKEISSGSEPGDLEVLNNCCYSKGLFNSGKVRRVDPYEEMLNEHEDYLYERDMLLEWLRSTKKNATKLYEAISEGKIKQPNPEEVDNYFTPYNFRFIERMYGSIHGAAMVDELRQAAHIVLPFIMKRLDQINSFSYQPTC